VVLWKSLGKEQKKQTTMRSEIKLPWYTALLSGPAEGKEFDRLVREFALSSQEDKKASIQWYLNKKLGVSVFVRKGKINSIQLYSAEHPDFEGFQGRLPLGLDFEMTRDKVHALLGEPDHVTPAVHICPDLEHAGIDRYYRSTCTVAVSYSKASGRLEVLGFESKTKSSS
jgi:hypothetical protein